MKHGKKYSDSKKLIESLKLYENYVQTLYLYQKISGQFTNMNYILEQSAK